MSDFAGVSELMDAICEERYNFHDDNFFFEFAFSQLDHHHFTTFVSYTNCIVVSIEYRLDRLKAPHPRVLPRLLAHSHVGCFR
ncbi:hypothetical protein Fmac_025650 [Flemingia macrophylla]|uniref:Maturase K n=1 Tax=Flemingia macrophylla TaxID=520843 RepID=A0ABD1LST8_9FABA